MRQKGGPLRGESEYCRRERDSSNIRRFWIRDSDLGGEHDERNGASVDADLTTVFVRVDRRTGFVGERLTDSALIDGEVSERTIEDARQFGMVGHAQKVTRVRGDGPPLLLRRDFDSTADGEAGLYFLSLQRGIGDFERTREPTNGADVAGTSAVGARLNNGILQYVFVQRRGNFLLPPRPSRTLPGV